MCVGEELRTLRIAAALKVRSIFGGLFRFAERNCGHFAALKKGTRLVRSLFSSGNGFHNALSLTFICEERTVERRMIYRYITNMLAYYSNVYFSSCTFAGL